MVILMFTMLSDTVPNEFLGVESWTKRMMPNADSVLSITGLFLCDWHHLIKYYITDTSNKYGFTLQTSVYNALKYHL